MNKSIVFKRDNYIEFESNINIDNGFENVWQEHRHSSMEYFGDKEGGQIEWIIDNGTWIEHIGIWTEGGKLVDYDGVFELPGEAVVLLRKNGVIVPRSFLE